MTNKEQLMLLQLQLKQAQELLEVYNPDRLPYDYTEHSYRADLKQVLQAVRKSSIEWEKRAYC